MTRGAVIASVVGVVALGGTAFVLLQLPIWPWSRRPATGTAPQAGAGGGAWPTGETGPGPLAGDAVLSGVDTGWARGFRIPTNSAATGVPLS